MAEPVIVDRVTKHFAGHTAVDSLSLGVSSGIIYGLLGPNGAGKTTTLRMIMDIYEPDGGEVRLFGQVGGGRANSARIGYLPEERGLYPKMRVLDVLVFLAEAKGVARRTARTRALEWLDRLGLADWRLRKVSDLSKGMQQKVQFISTVLHDPELVILDEPFSGLDPVNSQVLRDTVIDYRRQGKTVLFSTHIMEHAEKLCDRLCIIARGKKLIDGTLAEVKKHARRQACHRRVRRQSGETRRRYSRTGAWWPSSRTLASRRSSSWLPAPMPRRSSRHSSSPARASHASSWRGPSLHKIFVDLVGPEAATAAAVPGAESARGGERSCIRSGRSFAASSSNAVRTKWFWVSAILGPVLFAGIIVFQIMQSVGGAVRDIAIVDTGSLGYGAQIAEALGASRTLRASTVTLSPGVLDSLTALVESKHITGS